MKKRINIIGIAIFFTLLTIYQVQAGEWPKWAKDAFASSTSGGSTSAE